MSEREFQAGMSAVSTGESLSQAAMCGAVRWLMTGQADQEQVAQFLLALRAKGETAEELAGAAQAMREHVVPIHSRHARLIDTCGTGGVGSDLFNVSTTAAIVAAAAGQALPDALRFAVAKHGNRSITSRSGSADVLTALGVNIEASPEVVGRCLDEVGIGFCFAPILHPAMRHVAPIRKRLGVGTIFNLLGPLCNPASAAYQLVGIGRPEYQERIATALQRLGTRRSAVVSGADHVGEVTIAGETRVMLVTSSGMQSFCWTPSAFGLSPATLDTLRISDAASSAAMVHRVLSGERHAARDMVVLNAAAALWVVEAAADLHECARMAESAIDRGAAQELLRRWAALSQKH